MRRQHSGQHGGTQPRDPPERCIVLRIGVNLGDIIVEDDDIYGGGVNVAARLEGLAKPGGVCISDTVHENVKTKLSLSFEDLGPQQVKSIAEPIHAWRILPEGSVAQGIVAGARSVLLPDKPSIAVLPFNNMSGDPEQEYFSDGITEDIITELSRFRNLCVIARNSSFTFKGHAVEVTEVGKKLGARYVVEGSVRRIGNRVRVTVQLVEAETQNHVWAERYDRNLEDIFDLQDEVVRTIVTTLPAQLDVEATELARRKPTEDQTAYDCCLRGEWHFLRGEFREAKTLFARAVATDPGYARALARLAWLHAYSIFFEGTPPDDSVRMARDFGERALAADNADARVAAISASAFLMCGDFDLAERYAKRAMALNPNDAATIRDCGFVEIYTGRFEAGMAAIRRGTELDPRNVQSWHEALFDAHYMMRDFDEAIALFRGWREAPPHMYGELAAAYAQLGRMDEAHQAAETCRRLLGGASKMEAVAKHHLRICRRREDAEGWLEGYRKAGLDI
jgi:adenylate cyclase